MIEYISGDLLDAPERIIIHGCNAQGVMGSGVAKAIRAKWPQAYETYRMMHEYYDGLKLGQIVPVRCDDKYIINAITQEFYGRDPNVVYVSYDAIRECMSQIAKMAPVFMEGVVAMPKIGAGLGNGDWTIIEKIIKEEMKITDVDGSEIEIDVKVYVL